jgi:hypothetical protein
MQADVLKALDRDNNFSHLLHEYFGFRKGYVRWDPYAMIGNELRQIIYMLWLQSLYIMNLHMSGPGRHRRPLFRLEYHGKLTCIVWSISVWRDLPALPAGA